MEVKKLIKKIQKMPHRHFVELHEKIVLVVWFVLLFLTGTQVFFLKCWFFF